MTEIRFDEGWDERNIYGIWDGHRADCERCNGYVDGKPATLALVCPYGAQIIKYILELAGRSALAAKRKAAREFAKQHLPKRASRRELDAVMRYVEPDE